MEYPTRARPTRAETNWAGNLSYHAARWHRPRDLAGVQAAVRAADQLRALGTRHTFNGLADTPADLISLEHLNRTLDIDPARRTVTIEGGVRYGELSQALHAHGLALHNLASLPHISVAGACMTATHGSGDRAPSLATAVSALELVTADGEVRGLSRAQHGKAFDGMVVSLGGLGVVIRLTLDLEPIYEVRQDVYEHLALEQVEAHFDRIMAGADSVSLFTTWQSWPGDGHFHQVWLKRRVDPQVAYTPAPIWFGATLARHDLHPMPGGAAGNCTPQGGQPGPWFERWPHFRLDHTPSHGEELQSEYFVPREHAPAALRALHNLGPRLAPLLLVSEVRTVAADRLWLSPAYQQDSATIHFTWRRDEPAVREVLIHVEQALAPFGARPHWGKVFAMSPEQLAALYPKLPDFRRLLTEYDPAGKFRNAFLNAYVFGAGAGIPSV